MNYVSLKTLCKNVVVEDPRRQMAATNLLVAAVNAAQTLGHIALPSPTNHWPDLSAGIAFSFCFEDAIPGLGWIGDIGNDELSVHASLYPKPRALEVIAAGDAGFHAGDVFATGWLERRTGCFLQTEDGALRLWCRQQLLHAVAAAQVIPIGFSREAWFRP